MRLELTAFRLWDWRAAYCATEAYWEPWEKIMGSILIYARKKGQKICTHGGTRTPNLRFRRPTPYPLGHAGTHSYAKLSVLPLIGPTSLPSTSGYRTRFPRMGILHDTTTPATPTQTVPDFDTTTVVNERLASSVGTAWDSLSPTLGATLFLLKYCHNAISFVSV